jgi:hypothetical protein
VQKAGRLLLPESGVAQRESAQTHCERSACLRSELEEAAPADRVAEHCAKLQISGEHLAIAAEQIRERVLRTRRV